MQQTQTNAPPPLASPGLVSGGVIPAAPPSRSEVERKLSFRSAAPRDLPKKKRSPSQVSTDSDHSISSHGIGYSTSTSAQSNLIGQSQGQNQAQGQNQSQIGSAPSSGFSAPSSSGLSGGGGVGTGIGINTNPNAPLLSSSNPTSPSLSSAPSIPGLPSSTPQTPGTGQGQGMHGLSAIAERLSGTAIGEDMEEYEEEHEHGNSGSEGEGGEGEGEEGESAQERAERVQGQMRMDDERVMRSGYLYKKQEKRKVWKKKWFVLRTGKLAYYKDDREYSLSRVIDLRDIHTAAPVKIKKHSFTFGIVTKQRTFLAEASSQSEMDEWVAAITGAKRKLTDEAEKRATAGPGQAHAAQGGDVGGGGGKGAGEMVMSPAQLHPAPGQGLPGVHPHSTQGYATSGATGAVSIGQPPTHGQGQGQGQIQGSRRNPSMTSTSARSARREPSASSLSSVGHGDYFPRNASTSGTANIAGGGVALAPPLSASAGTSPMSMSHVQVLPAHAHQGPQGQVQGLSSDSEDDHESHANFSDFGTSLGAGSLYMDGIGTGHQAGQGQGQAQNAGVARSPSTGLTLNLNVPGTGKTIVSQAQAQQHPTGVGGGTPMQTPSAQQAQQHPQKQSQQQQAYLGNVDPSRVILSGYLMKRSHGRGRKVWRKRWWVLTSAGLTYAKSHMDTKASRHIPLSSILDALEQPADSSQDGSDSDSDGHGHGPQRSASKSMRSPSMRRGSSFMPIPMPGSGAGSSRADGVLGTSFSGEPGSSLGTSVTGSAATSGAGVGSSGMAHSPSAASALGGSGTGSSGNAGQGGDHLFRLITAKRTFTLCAPTEEDEIKWLAGVKALLNRERERSQAQAQAQAQSQAAKQAQNAGAGPGVGVGSPNMGEVPRMFPAQQSQQTQQHQQQPQQQGGVPRITQQPPTPSLSPNAPSTSHVASPPTPQQQQQQHPQQPGSPTSPTSPTSLSGRGRSATYTAKSAVEEVVRRYHPERQAQAS